MILLCTTLVGCVTCEPCIEKPPKEVKIPVPVPCQVQNPEKPTLSFPTIKEEDDIFTKVKVLLADKILQEGYTIQLETALQSCKN